MRSRLKQLIDTGAHAGLSLVDRKHVRATNLTALVSAMSISAWVPLAAMTGRGWVALENAVCALVFLSAIRLNHNRRYLLAVALVIAGVHAQMALATFLFGGDSGVDLFYPTIIIGPYLMFPRSRRRHAHTWAAIGGMIWAATIALAFNGHLPVRVVGMSQAARITTNLCIALASLLAIAYGFIWIVDDTEDALVEETQRADRLLLNVLPASIAERLKAGESNIADSFQQVTVMFADIVGFTPLSARLSPEALVARLNVLFTDFDGLATQLGLEKIKTIGDAYMVVGGLPEPMPDAAGAMARMALAMIEAVERRSEEAGDELSLRIGIHSGPAVAGVIGDRKFAYDVWGDTVNTASRMESHAEPGRIQVSDATRQLLGERFELEPRGEIEIKGKGAMKTWFLKAERQLT